MPGTRAEATVIASAHYLDLDLPDGVEQIGQGAHRTVYLSADGTTVYKVGVDGANRREVATLTRLRADGHRHAPEVSLFEVTLTVYGDEETATVVAMPYLPDDGSVARPYPILEGAADFNPGNVHANGGQVWLIDAGGY
ncbi:hypothetical protein [Catenuloplanes japonicus]|uniref:hypothetical protein n=1 Tax=Catenuloplanes japonicus TaxID=33876 RepID=UPI00052754BB|nr:hypothetical protein [Catenuloplanes japonicus]